MTNHCPVWLKASPALLLAALLVACGPSGHTPASAPTAPTAGTATPPPSAAPGVPPTTASIHPRDLVAPAPVPFGDAVARAGQQLVAQAVPYVGYAPRAVVIDPLIDANTGAQTTSTVRMGEQLQQVVRAASDRWTVQPLTRAVLQQAPLLLIGTLTPVNVERAVDTKPDAFRVWLTLIDLRTGRIVGKQLDRATVDTVNPEPLPYYRDSPTWHKDRTVLGYINSCQVNTKIGDPADPDYLARLPAAAVVNEAIQAYDAGKLPQALQLYQEARALAEPGDLRVLNGLYLTGWQLGQRDVAREAFSGLVASGLEQQRLPIKLLFQPGKTTFTTTGDLPEQYTMWIASLADGAGKTAACVRVVGHTSRTGSARLNETLSRQRAEAVKRLLERDNRALSAKLTAAGVGSREALVGLGTDDARDALDRRVEFRVVNCI
tara:strand:+ start:2636 stop:3937 length:1302 start_codon:yes stop_codon:yes gene_type:complete